MLLYCVGKEMNMSISIIFWEYFADIILSPQTLDSNWGNSQFSIQITTNLRKAFGYAFDACYEQLDGNLRVELERHYREIL